ncbi:10220_t:CDS:2, partial [Paraglomus brasilianum]
RTPSSKFDTYATPPPRSRFSFTFGVNQLVYRMNKCAILSTAGTKIDWEFIISIKLYADVSRQREQRYTLLYLLVAPVRAASHLFPLLEIERWRGQTAKVIKRPFIEKLMFMTISVSYDCIYQNQGEAVPVYPVLYLSTPNPYILGGSRKIKFVVG